MAVTTGVPSALADGAGVGTGGGWVATTLGPCCEQATKLAQTATARGAQNLLMTLLSPDLAPWFRMRLRLPRTPER
ncbi:hypothetical protein Rhe02_26410 [Rhizocola hellebori]|uniref:Uncharacterized protein n=1 Tax=Rhizocola hellebori TaxID=1392758 RepID=A0A8J3Q619_9ACTN|nr:hypothetical protein Rhe02_26410 [Rhizocola hellebori]